MATGPSCSSLTGGPSPAAAPRASEPRAAVAAFAKGSAAAASSVSAAIETIGTRASSRLTVSRSGAAGRETSTAFLDSGVAIGAPR